MDALHAEPFLEEVVSGRIRLRCAAAEQLAGSVVEVGTERQSGATRLARFGNLTLIKIQLN